MAIELRPAGEAKSQALAGEIIGKGEARKQAASDVREANARASQEAMQQKAMDWEAQKMQMRSAQDFAQELRLNGARLNAEARAREWEVEKMEIISQADFAHEERVRSEKMGQFSDTMAYIKGIEQEESHPKETTDDMKFRLASQYQGLGIPEVSEILGEHDAAMRLQEQEEKSDFGVLPGEFELLTEDERTKAAKIRTGLDIRPSAKDMAYENIKKIDNVTAIMDDFEENGDVNPGWGTTIVPLAVRDSKGNLTEATPAQTQLYNNAKLLLGELTTSIEVPEWIGDDPAEQEKYKQLIRYGKTPEEIKSRLGK